MIDRFHKDDLIHSKSMDHFTLRYSANFTCAVCKKWYGMAFSVSGNRINTYYIYPEVIDNTYFVIPLDHEQCRDLFKMTPFAYL